jgi:lipoprotein-releasing system permease protein
LNLVLFIARKYFLIGRKINFINIISVLSMLVVTIVTISMVVVLSVLNGMEDVIRSLYNTFDPEIKIAATTGKTFLISDSLSGRIKNTEGVALITEVIEDNAIVSYKNEKDVVKVKGVSDNFIAQHRLDSMMVAGKLELKNRDTYYAILGAGLQYKLSVSLADPFAPLNFYYPNRKKIKKPDAPDAFNSLSIQAGGVFAIEKQYDDYYVFVPLEFAQELLEYGDKRTSLEIKIKPGYTIPQVQENLKKTLGAKFIVLNSDQQHTGIIRAIRVEKLAVYIILSLLLAVSSVGIYFCLTMLTIRKRKDIAVLKSMGATSGLIRSVFLVEGMIIAFSGALLGLVTGYLLCYLQQSYGFVPLGMETSLVKSYPVKLQGLDFLVTSLIVFVLTMIASYLPALKASRIEIQENIK